jgi:hypothetical protein
MAGIAGREKAGITAKGAGTGTGVPVGMMDIRIPIIGLTRISTAAPPQVSTMTNGSGRDATGCGIKLAVSVVSGCGGNLRFENLFAVDFPS